MFAQNQLNNLLASIFAFSKHNLGSETDENNVVSSAKDNIWLSVHCATSFTYSRYKRGPKIDPCGTPHSILQTLLTLSNLNKFLSVHKVINQPVFNVTPLATILYTELNYCVIYLQVITLDAVPDIDMIIFLPDILDGLFQILGDQNTEIRKM